VTWELHGRYEGALVRDAVGGYGELWAAVAGVSNAGKFDRGGAPRRGSFCTSRVLGVRVGYAIDETRLGGGAWRETVTGVRLAVGNGHR
jgi:hypothetical protein